MARLGLGFGYSSGDSGGGTVTPGKVYWIDGLATFGPSFNTISGDASFPNHDYEVVGAGVLGSTTFTRSSGDNLSDLGTDCVFVVMEDADGNLETNVTNGYSGSDVTLIYPLGITATKLHQGWQGALEQHLSAKGAAALAQHIVNAKKQDCYKSKATYAIWHGDVFTDNERLRPSAANLWKGYGGVSMFGFFYNDNLNMFLANGKIIAGAPRCLRVNVDAQGEGANATFSTNNEKAMLEFTIGESETADAEILVTILEDGVSAFTGTYGPEINMVRHVVDATVDEIEVRIQINNADTTNRRLRIGAISLCSLTDIEGEETDPVIAPDATVLFVGDSWLDDANVHGAPFDTEFDALHSGTVYNEAIGGSVITDWTGSFSGWLSSYNPDVVVFHSGINEVNADTAGDAFWEAVDEIAGKAIAAGADFVIMMQGATASNSQTNKLGEMFAEFEDSATSTEAAYEIRYPRLVDEFIFEASVNEFTTAEAVINLRNKVPSTRVVERLSDNVDLTPTGTAPSDAWEAA